MRGPSVTASPLVLPLDRMERRTYFVQTVSAYLEMQGDAPTRVINVGVFSFVPNAGSSGLDRVSRALGTGTLCSARCCKSCVDDKLAQGFFGFCLVGISILSGACLQIPVRSLCFYPSTSRTSIETSPAPPMMQSDARMLVNM